MTPATTDALVFFGATGDLAYRKVFPALHALARRGELRVPVIGVSSTGPSLRKAYYSNYGTKQVDVVAPGGDRRFQPPGTAIHGGGRVLGAWPAEAIGSTSPSSASASWNNAAASGRSRCARWCRT